MILKALEMQGFKSFPDKTVLSFGKGITAVVGPNGSGKSNISDAVRWVLGEQSTKSLRGSRMEDVIFGGTSLRKALGYAEVTLRLDNTDRSLHDCDRDEVAVTRRFYRSGESEYRINGEECRLRDIHELFMDTGLGRDGYSMVSQGRIADLVSARSTQRRDMLEEAAGISHLRYRRTDANRRLAQAEENLVRLRDILAELEGRIGPLKTQSEKAQKFLALSSEKKTLEIGLWLHTIEKSKAGLREQERKLSIAAAQYAQSEARLSALNEEIDAAIEQAHGLTAEAEQLRQTIAALEEEAAVLDGRIAVEQNSIAHNNATIERISGDMGDGTRSVQTLEEQIRAAQAENAGKEATIDAKTAEAQEALEQLNALLGQSSAGSEKLREINETMTALALKLADERVRASTAASTAEALAARVAEIDAGAGQRQTALDAIEREHADADAALKSLRDAADGHENSMDGYRMLLDSRSGKAETLRKEIESIHLDIYQKNARIKMLDDLEKNLDGYAGSVQKVIREAKRGTLRGIRGTVSQLISVPAEYAVAIETALGAALQNVVTEDENAAKRAILFLKEQRAGRATFLPLTSVTARPFTEKGLENCAGYIDMAADLVACDAAYDAIIGSLLGRTAVAETIDDAIAIAKKYGYRFRIVTLDGQLVNAGGSMTGGSRGAGVGFLSRMTEIEALKTSVAALEKTLAQKQTQHKSISEELAQVQATLDAVNAELLKAQEEIIRAEAEAGRIHDRRDAVRAQLEEFADEKRRAQEKIEQMTLVGRVAEERIEAIRKEQAQAETALAAQNEELASVAKLTERSNEIHTALNLEIVALKKEIEANNEIIETNRRLTESYSERADRMEAEIAGFRQKNEELSALITALTAEAAGKRAQAQALRGRIAALTDAREQREAESTALRGEERGVAAEKERLSGELARLEERRDAMQRELETAQNKLYDEYQLTLREAIALNITLEDIPKSQRTLQEIRGKIRALGSVNVGAVEEYKEVSARYEFMNGQITDVEKSKAELEKLIAELTGKMAERFREQFRRINNSFGETFRALFDGGRAELVLEDPQDVLECSINIRVQPPGKNVQNIDLLSGGEKGLSAIALLFAILKVTPAPFCIFDEVEAALDDVNVTRYAQYVRSMTDRTQFILITHRRGTMEEADSLYGVTMQEEGVSKLLELKTAEMAKKLGLE